MISIVFRIISCYFLLEWKRFFVQSSCIIFCSEFLYYFLFRVPVLFSVQGSCIIFCSRFLYYFLFRVPVLFSVQGSCIIFCSGSCIIFCSGFLYYFLFRVPVLFTVQSSCIIFCSVFLYYFLFRVPVLFSTNEGMYLRLLDKEVKIEKNLIKVNFPKKRLNKKFITLSPQILRLN